LIVAIFEDQLKKEISSCFMVHIWKVQLSELRSQLGIFRQFKI